MPPMPRRLAVFVLLPLLAGCYAGTRVSGNRSYLNDGYKYEGPLGKFVHSEDENRNEMWIGYGFDEKKLIDEGCDGTLDEIRYRGSNYRWGFVRIDSVSAGSQAEKAGLLAGDILVAIDGKEIKTIEDARWAIQVHRDTLEDKLRDAQTIGEANAAKEDESKDKPCLVVVRRGTGPEWVSVNCVPPLGVHLSPGSDDPTIAELFAQASAEYNRYYDSMFVHEIHENWTGWRAYGVARENGYFKK